MTTDTAAIARPDLSLIAKLWIGFMLLAQVWNIWRTVTVIEDLVSHSDPRWEDDGFWWSLPASTAISLLTMLALALLFLRFRLAFYAACALAAAGVALNLAAGVGGPMAFAGLVGFVILGVLLRQRWSALR